MSNINLVRKRLTDGSLLRFGENISINGITVKAIFADEEFDDEAGRYRRTTLTIARPDAQFFRKGDTVLVRDRAFTITFIPDIHEDLIDIEIKNA